MSRVALYLRISKTDGSRTAENQRPEVEQLARARGTIVATYEEAASAVKKRPQYDAMLQAARRGEFNAIVVWAIDRFGRSMMGNLNDILELDRIGVQVLSVRESWLDTSGPMRQLLVAIFSWAAEQERTRLVERTKAGIERARREGKRLGRPRRKWDKCKASELLEGGASMREVARQIGVPYATLQRGLGR